jgi:hypothetical protein
MTWQRGPAIAAINPAEPSPRWQGSAPAWQFYHYNQLPWRPIANVTPMLTVYNRKGNVIHVRFLKNG